jgi:hypothetical protein
MDFDQQLQAARPSLNACVRDINALCARAGREDLSRLALHTLRESADEHLAAETLVAKYGDLLAGLQFVFRGAAKAGLAGGDALDAKLQAHTDLSVDARAVLCQSYGAHYAALSGKKEGEGGGGAAAAVKVLGLGKFVGLDWKVGVGVQSSNCVNLCTPFVALNLRISVDGRVQTHSLELSIEEFGNFASAVKECSKAMEDC